MIQLGKKQQLEVVRSKEFGVYLGEGADDEGAVLLPKKQVPEYTKVGDKLEVFIYKDSEDRLIATTSTPKIFLGETAVLTVKEVGKIGVFLDMGLEKDLLLPFKEQNHKLSQGEECLVALYVDKSERLAATMKVYPYMSNASSYQKDEKVSGTVYEINDNLGAFVAVDNRYYGLIPQKELYRDVHEGDVIEARVTKVREDGKLDLSPRDKVYVQMDSDAILVMKVLDTCGGILPFTD
ncbi:MAG: S1-like domain-containing RNA-binding protein, partial [Hungatella sp.]